MQARSFRQRGPPFLYVEAYPFPLPQTMNVKPIPYKLPNSNNEAAMDKKIFVVLFDLLA
jgi:hypothetical protein